MKNCVTIAGSDCSGGAGIQADIKTFCANGVYAMSVITSVVSENTNRVIDVFDLPVEIIKKQIDAIFEDIRVDAVKIGMIKNTAIMNCVADKLVQYNPPVVVVDPVMSAKDNHCLMEKNALYTLKKRIFPLTTIVTPNIPETQVLTGKSIKNIQDIFNCAKDIYNMGVKNVLIKGGHFDGKPIDVLYDGKSFYKFISERIHTKNTHGTGCTFSSAITAYMARGYTPQNAILNAKKYIYNAILNSLEIGKGNGPLHHFYDYYTMKGFE